MQGQSQDLPTTTPIRIQNDEQPSDNMPKEKKTCWPPTAWGMCAWVDETSALCTNFCNGSLKREKDQNYVGKQMV
jgi:hypothetical protein